MSTSLRQDFSHRLPKPVTEIELILDDCFFVFDTNVLLDVYKLKQESREYFFTLLDRIIDRLFLPRHVANEFFNRRVGVILEGAESYNDLEKAIDKQINLLKNTNSHPFVSDETLAQLEQVWHKAKEDMKSNREILMNRIKNDEILEKYFNVFENKLGEANTETEQEALDKEYKKRIEKKLPPGITDARKQSGNASGDFIIWRQILKQLESLSSNLVFVTNERKEDWYELAGGENLGPHPVLKKEYSDSTSKSLHIYSLENFMKAVGLKFGIPAQESVLENVKEVAEERSNYAYKSITKDVALEEFKLCLQHRGKPYVKYQTFIYEHLGNKGFDYKTSFSVVDELCRNGNLVKESKVNRYGVSVELLSFPKPKANPLF